MSKTKETNILSDLYTIKCNKNNPTCFVKDVIGSKVRIIFVLESPEKEEVRQLLPAVGSTGKAMSRHLFEWKRKEKVIGIGKLIDNNGGYASNFGIVNVSSHPLQCREIPNYLRTSVKTLDRITNIKAKKSIKGSIDESKCINLLEYIESNFRIRISNVLEEHPNILIIPCGNFARSFFESYITNSCLDQDQKDRVYPEWAKQIPHPSFGHWDKSSEVEEMLDEIFKNTPDEV